MTYTEAATCKEYLRGRQEGKRQVSRSLRHYRLEAILAVGYRVRSPPGDTQSRQRATARLSEYLVKTFVMDDERLKNPGGWDYFDELLARIREKRRRPAGVLDGRSEATEARRVGSRAAVSNRLRANRLLSALSSDYQAREKEPQLFFAV